jgi:hypothetical protein
MPRPFSAVSLFAVLCPLLVGCASRPTYSPSQSTFPTIASGNGRVFIYRPPGLVRLKHDILIDGKFVGECNAGEVFFVDMLPGTHTVSCNESSVSIHLLAGESRYVLLDVCSVPNLQSVLPPFYHRLQPILVHPDQGSRKIQGLHYTPPSRGP